MEYGIAIIMEIPTTIQTFICTEKDYDVNEGDGGDDEKETNLRRTQLLSPSFLPSWLSVVSVDFKGSLPPPSHPPTSYQYQTPCNNFSTWHNMSCSCTRQNMKMALPKEVHFAAVSFQTFLFYLSV